MAKPKNEPAPLIIDDENLKETVEILGPRETWKMIQKQFAISTGETVRKAKCDSYHEGHRDGQNLSAIWTWVTASLCVAVGALLIIWLGGLAVKQASSYDDSVRAYIQYQKDTCAAGNTAACMAAVAEYDTDENRRHSHEYDPYGKWLERAALLRSLYKQASGKPLPGTR